MLTPAWHRPLVSIVALSLLVCSTESQLKQPGLWSQSACLRPHCADLGQGCASVSTSIKWAPEWHCFMAL